jgi:DNA-binding response OmpR family regulator
MKMITTKEVAHITKGFSILFVEDDDDVRENTAEILKRFFKHVQTSTNGECALEKYIEYYENNSKYYDIILSDIQMPILDGVELTKHIYSINESQVIIILSAFDESEYLISLINLGIEQFIKKPIDYQELLRAFQSVSKKILHNSFSPEKDVSMKIQLSRDFSYNRENKFLLNIAENIYLTKYEIILMQLLSTNVGKIYSNEDIVENYISVNETIDAKNIRKLISKLRKKLPDNCLESIYGIGYKIVPYFEV